MAKDLSASLPRPGWRFLASCLVIGHLWAVLGRPLDFATQGPNGSSPATGAIYAPIRGYAEFAYLNHGYAFFAPDPGPSHLIRVTATKSDGRSETVMYPDRNRQWPRLLYHRHFMLTEFLHTLYQPQDIPAEMEQDRMAVEDWKRRRLRFEAVRDSLQRHLAVALEGSRIEMQRIEHQLVGLPEFLGQGIRLDDPRLYIELPDGSKPASDIPQFGVPNLRGNDTPAPLR